ncbi:MAG: carboxypeptidase regulatory-like domain-containing protein [Deltaproteobacteria bacterium]|nr:carboxypeptidase regulatory-like domain-containing protein [Deltaproteobacteria bacterium]
MSDPSSRKAGGEQRLRMAVTVQLLGLAALGWLCGCGTTLVRGQVLDDQKQPVRGAAIATEPPTDMRISDQQGRFAVERLIDQNNNIQPLTPGSYTLIIRKLGFEDKTLPIQLEKRQELDLGSVVLERKKLDVKVDDVEASMQRGPSGIDVIDTPLRGE